MKFSIGSNQNKIIIPTIVLFLSACTDSKSNPDAKVEGVFQAAISAVSSDFGSSEISIANGLLADDPGTPDLDESLNSYNVANGFAAQDLSDITVASYGKSFYRLGRSSQNNITKFNFETPELDEWQFSVNDEGSSVASNPQDVIFVSEQKAYVLRYGSDSILIINPSVAANDEDGFKIGTIDLSAYNDPAQTVPFMRAAVLNDGKLYVVMQVMDGDWVPGIAKLAIIDITTDEELLTSNISLTVKNPIDLDVLGNYLYVSGIGRYANSWSTPPTPAEYTGGIEKINLNNLSSELLVDDGDGTEQPYGQINGLALISESLGYFRGYSAWANESIFQFNPSTGIVDSEPVIGFDGADIRALTESPDQELWVGMVADSNPVIKVINPTDNSLISEIFTSKIPSEIVFSGNLAE
ncbi:MAG: hypothetical protein ACI84K_000266 [Pseudohongiellaceae bacterium]|jgi:hypothetical protein